MVVVAMIKAQRAPFAGQRPNGYKDRLVPKNETDVPLPNRFGGNDISSSTPRLPHDAIGDAVAVDILNRRPIEQRPFWLINSAAIEAHRNGGVPAQTNPTITNTAELANRFGGFDVNSNNVISQQEIVYPVQHQNVKSSIQVTSTQTPIRNINSFGSTSSEGNTNNVQSAAIKRSPDGYQWYYGAGQQPQHSFGHSYHAGGHY